jgi:SRSO17 transposase
MDQPIAAGRRRRVYAADVSMVRRVLAERHGQPLPSIAAELCRLWAWRNLAGGPAVADCVEVLHVLRDRGLIELDLGRRGRRPAPQSVPVALDTTPLEGPLGPLLPAELRVVSGTELEPVWDYLVGRHHPLGVPRLIGPRLKTLAWLCGRAVAAFLWGRAALKLASRDRLLGDTPAERRAARERVVTNHRFVIFPWVSVHLLASHLLGLAVRRIGPDWQRAFGQSLELLETFVDPTRYAGTCYRAAGWVPVGLTRGSGRPGGRYRFHGRPKQVLLYPLTRAMRSKLARLPPGPVASGPFPSSASTSPLPASAEPPELRGGEPSMIELAPVPSIQLPGERMTEADCRGLGERLSSHTGNFRDLLGHDACARHGTIYVAGLLSPLPRKSVEPIALHAPTPVAPRTLQWFLSQSGWSADAVCIRHQTLVAQSLGDPVGVLSLDGSDFPKKGKESVGVARQYCGATGKTDNCQAGVFLSYASRHGATLVDGRLYLPQHWFSDEQRERREKCKVPAEVRFKTKIELAIDLLTAVSERGVLPARWVTADASFGRDLDFRHRVGELGYRYLVEVPKNLRVYRERPPMVERSRHRGKVRVGLRPRPGENKPVRVDAFLDDSSIQWQRVVLKESAKGPLVARMAAVRVHEVVGGDLAGPEVWLVIRRWPLDQKVKFYLSNAPASMAIEELFRVTTLRWSIEVCFEECKGALGMDHYEARSWAAWHHHMALVFLAHHFLVLARAELGKKTPP